MQRDISKKGAIRQGLISLIIAAACSCAVAVMLFGLSTSLPAAQEGQGNTETVHYDSSGASIGAYIAKPKGEGKHPAVIVIHDTQGLTDGIRGMARQFAEAGFVAMAPDLLSRAGGTTTPQAAAGAIRDMSLNTPLQDLRAAFEYLQKDSSVDANKISAVGYGWGGWRSFSLAASQPGLYRAVVYSGSTPTEGLQNVTAPVLAHYAQFDFRITGNAIWTEDTMKELGKKYSFYIYPNTEHAFFNEAGQRYDAAAAKLAWTRTLDFLR